jgi:hypothetical protein
MPHIQNQSPSAPPRPVVLDDAMAAVPMTPRDSAMEDSTWSVTAGWGTNDTTDRPPDRRVVGVGVFFIVIAVLLSVLQVYGIVGLRREKHVRIPDVESPAASADPESPTIVREQPVTEDAGSLGGLLDGLELISPTCLD